MRPLPSLPRTVVLCGIAALLAFLAVPVSPAAAQPVCEAPGGAGPPERQWQLRRLAPESVWPLTTGAGITVAVIDSGVSRAHPMLRGKIRTGRDFNPDLANESGLCDEFGHGTIIAGIIAGEAIEGELFHGVAPGTRILPGRVLQGDDADGADLPGLLAEAIVWAVDEGAKVINLSVEARETGQLANAVRYAADNDVVMVAAAGNVDLENGQQSPGAPAVYEEVLAVAGVDQEGRHVESSQAADYVDVAAPGTDIYGPATGDDGYFGRVEGTSFAAPYVSGVAALVRAYHPDLSAAEVVERIIQTADRPPDERNPQVGHGVVNPYRAVTAVLGSRPNPPAAQLAPPAAAPDPLATPRRVAAWAALGGALLAALLLLLPPAIRRGRQRRWRPAHDPS